MGFRKLSPFLSCNSLLLEVLYRVLHPSELGVQAASLRDKAVQLTPEIVDVLLEQRLQALPHGLGALLLQQGPLGFQDLVLLLQESDLDEDKMVICATKERRKEGRKEGRKRGGLTVPKQIWWSPWCWATPERAQRLRLTVLLP